ncbi:hydrogenase nickel incorporation protein HypA [Caloramator mitchellensis]|uniref:Hydrogenase maturation factor HypA n=1 Tax=Caloramator mitchellensis TaxID=908809 RepID=A0A0R3JSX3_CALMK|nr:hydrogenase maturation nickel metallochaperone HypA [Caloramator mitchellensis]KRQ86611.1 hydrogenase nickel incorporation protein HypA [Caloramator mitchellensis]
MHELAITEGIIKIAIDAAKQNSANKILNIKIKCGDFSGVVPQLIHEYFDIVSKETLAEGAKLLVERIPISIICNDCNTENVIEKSNIKCPNCGSFNYRIIGGKEFFIDSVEVE